MAETEEVEAERAVVNLAEVEGSAVDGVEANEIQEESIEDQGTEREEIKAEANSVESRTQYFMSILNSLSMFKDDPYYKAAVYCFTEQLIATKVLLVKEPLEALDECKDESCYKDVEIEMELTTEEVDEQMRKCLEFYNATGPLYDDLLKAIGFLHERSLSTIDELIANLKSNNSEKLRNLLHKIISMEKQLAENRKIKVNRKDKTLADFARELVSEP